MKLVAKNRNITKKIVAVIFAVTALTLMIAAMGCGSSDQVNNGSGAQTDTVQTNTTPATSTTATTNATTSTNAGQANVNPAEPCPPQPGNAPQPVIVSYAVNNANASFGDMITFTAQIQGDAASVRVIYGASGGDISTAHSISVMLAESTSGGITTWKTGVLAPHGAKMPGAEGQCFYRVEVISSDNTYTKAMDNQHNFHVNG
ncbi:MAG: hypothetical protein WC935_03735 [Thermoleophilia bacterium]